MRLVQNVIWLICVAPWLALRHLASAVAITSRPRQLAEQILIPVRLVPLGVELDPVHSPGRTDRIWV